MQYLLSHEFYKNFNIFITLYRKENLGWFKVIGNSLHTNSRRLLWSRKHMAIRYWRLRSSLFSVILIEIFVDKVMWLESMLDKVTVTAICRKLFFSLLMHYERDLTTGNSFLWLLFICIMTWQEKKQHQYSLPVAYNYFSLG